MARSLNRVQLIGNLTRDPELRYTPNGSAVCSFGIATNRSWNTDSGDKKEETEFHRIVAWNKLAEICSQFLSKGRKVFVEGRLATRSWTSQDGQQKSATEIVIDDMILLSDGRAKEKKDEDENLVEEPKEAHSASAGEAKGKKGRPKSPSAGSGQEENKNGEAEEEVSPDDIPF